jgi:hypothetical protein
LESVANAHTAADLHVRPVSKTALVSRSWAPRAIQEIHDAQFPAIHLMKARSESWLLLGRCGSESQHQVFESEQRFVRVTNLIALAKNFHKIFTFDQSRPGF